MGSLAPGDTRSPWRNYAPGWLGEPRPSWWGRRAPALNGLGTRAAPDLSAEPMNPEQVDWDWHELDEFADLVEATG